MSEPSMYRVVYVEPGKPAVEKRIGTKLEDLQAEVGGLIECIYSHNDGTIIVANDEAKLIGMEGNRRLGNGSIIAGPFPDPVIYPTETENGGNSFETLFCIRPAGQSCYLRKNIPRAERGYSVL